MQMSKVHAKIFGKGFLLPEVGRLILSGSVQTLPTMLPPHCNRKTRVGLAFEALEAPS